MSSLSLINKESVLAQWHTLREAMAETEAMMKAMGIKIPSSTPFNGSEPRTGTMSAMAVEAMKTLSEVSTPSVSKYIEEKTGKAPDPNAISNLLSKANKDGLLKIVGRVEGSKARKYEWAMQNDPSR